MTKRFLIREEVTDCNVGDALKMEDGYEVLCTEKRGPAYKIGDKWYYRNQLPDVFYTYKEVYPECSEYGTYYKEK